MLAVVAGDPVRVVDATKEWPQVVFVAKESRFSQQKNAERRRKLDQNSPSGSNVTDPRLRRHRGRSRGTAVRQFPPNRLGKLGNL
jgi:hypothetical protein